MDDEEESKHEDESEDGNEEPEDDESEEEEDIELNGNRWKEILSYAAKQCEDPSKPVWQEPYLSQFVEHMKDYVEAKNKFVRDLEFDGAYEKIDDLIQKNIHKGFGRQEATDAAWHTPCETNYTKI